MGRKIIAGESFPPLQARNIHGTEVTIPRPGSWTHLQFRRFAGCPICNLHLQSIIARDQEIVEAGIREVVVFHSSDAELLHYQGRFRFDVIGDPTKALYRKYGVESSISAFLSLKAWAASVKGNLKKDKPDITGMPLGGIMGLPAEFLISADGTVKASHYGKHAYDQWSVDELLALSRSPMGSTQHR
ncbi:AhpC/TSA family protein [Pseudomonas veronii]|uniref:AhpC/TSA family protein n=1 Tax=Pseudomonas veronii TaxID=76761 RepID=A0A7Y1A8T7_PSEVE|nr:peroxiredoxin-like family protein [Pseudomonas veronii]NMY11187.1 AhpC/TSA family protein [Pseudomonas veronii]